MKGILIIHLESMSRWSSAVTVSIKFDITTFPVITFA